MKTKVEHIVLALGLMVLLVIFGCGGGGGGTGGSGGGSGLNPYPGQYLEFITENGAGVARDPLSLQIGDQIKIVLANYDISGIRTTLPISTLTCSASNSDIQLLAGNKINVLHRPAGIFVITAQATVAGSLKTYLQDCTVPSGSTTISGKVIQDGIGAGVPYVQVSFYDASGTMIAGSRTGAGGLFTATVPANVKSISIKSSSVPAPPYYKSFIYKGKVYTMDASACPVNLSGIISGQNNSLPSTMAIFLQVDGPPPPPDGCVP